MGCGSTKEADHDHRSEVESAGGESVLTSGTHQTQVYHYDQYEDHSERHTVVVDESPPPQSTEPADCFCATPTARSLYPVVNLGAVEQKKPAPSSPTAVCASCKSVDNLMRCTQCTDLYVICRSCLVNGRYSHDRSHKFMDHCILPNFVDESVENAVLSPQGSSTSFRFGSMSDGASSSLFMRCKCCQTVMVEGMYKCEQCACDHIICSVCYDGKADHHDSSHTFKIFERVPNNSVRETKQVTRRQSVSGSKYINEYAVIQLLGHGSYGKVKLVQNIESHELFAVKIIRVRAASYPSASGLGLSGRRDVDVTAIQKEIAIMKIASQHANIVKLFEVMEDAEAKKMYLIMEFMEGGQVYKVGQAPLDLACIRSYGNDILSALCFIHSQAVYHRDVKPENILLSGKTAKLADFGVSSACGEAIKDTIGSPAFLCPEQLSSQEVAGRYVDSWAFAVTIYLCASGHVPFQGENFTDTFNAVLNTPVQFPPSMDPALHDLLTKMLNKDLASRLDVQGAFHHPFFCEAPRASLVPVCNLSPAALTPSDIANAVVTESGLDSCFHHYCKVEKQPESPGTEIASPQPAAGLGLHDLINACIVSTDRRPQLTIANQYFRDAPGEVARAKNAHTIELTNNHLRNFTLSLIHLQHLRVLKITRNSLTYIPKEIIELRDLRELHLGSNLIKSVPEEIKSMTALEVLKLNNNKLTVFPDIVLCLPALNDLSIINNNIMTVPEHLFSCTNLKVAMNNAPQAKKAWMRYLQDHRTVSLTILWNNVLPSEIADGIFVVNKRLLQHSRPLTGENIKHVLASQPAHLHTTPGTSDFTPLVEEDQEKLYTHAKELLDDYMQKKEAVMLVYTDDARGNRMAVALIRYLQTALKWALDEATHVVNEAIMANISRKEHSSATTTKPADHSPPTKP